MNETVVHLSTNNQSIPRTMVSAYEALELVLDATVERPVVDLPIFEAIGLVLAEPILADRDYPPFDRAMMDGYAVPEGAEKQKLRVVGEAAAGRPAETGPTNGCCIEIMTGAPCPAGTYAVVMKEQVHCLGDEVLIPDRINPGQHIALQGSDCQAGQVVLQAGDRIDSFSVAVLASLGKTAVHVIRRPRIGIITTGMELIAPEADPGPFQIRDGNGPMLAIMARDIGVEGPVVLNAGDEVNSILSKLEPVAHCDIVILTGGVSAGRYDLVPAALKQYGAEVIFHKVCQKPGKPLLVASRVDQLVFGLPGNPLACHLCFHRYVAPAVRKMQGLNPIRTVYFGRLMEAVQRKRGRAYFVPGIVGASAGAGELPLLRPVPGKSSADVFQSCGANCYLEIPPGSAAVPAGDRVGFTLFDDI